MNEPNEKPELFLPRTTMFFTAVSILMLLAFAAVIVMGLVLLLSLHGIDSGPAGD